MEHIFTQKIKEILYRNFDENADDILDKSQLIQYINTKTRSASRGSKARSSFANLYAIYVLIEDYLDKKFDKQGDYSKYEGVLYSKLSEQQKKLPFGNTLQNHALNNRMNSEFKKYFPSSDYTPILRDQATKRYWVNENLLSIKVGKLTFNIAGSVIEIVNEYVKTKQDAFERFVMQCRSLQTIEHTTPEKVEEFIMGLLASNVDARLFEIVSYSILKYFYCNQQIIWGVELGSLNTENLKLYKTGRTNANDGGIDFVMKPLGRFFQVTETLDFRKYFLDIDKIQKYPITFVIKSSETTQGLLKKIRDKAEKIYSIESIVDKYMDCIEELINIPLLKERFSSAIQQGYLKSILDEIIMQSDVEFNFHHS